MNAGMKMMLVSNRSRGGNRGGNRGGARNEMNYGRNEMNYGGGMQMGMDEMESRRRRDSRGRFRSEMENEMGGMENEMEMRRGGGRGGSGGRNEMEDRYGRSEMESRGRYGRNEMRGGYNESEMRAEMRGYPYRPFPVYEGGGSNMNQIGFNANPEIETNYRMNATHDTGNETEYKLASKMGGSSSSNAITPMNKETAEEWTQNMKNEDGTKGPHWKMEQVKQLMAQKGIQYNPWEFFAILNAMYSDYCAVFKKHGVNNMDMYIDLACAWLNDTDAMPEKASRYYEYIVKK